MAKKFDLLTLGEIMLRLSPPESERMTRGGVFQKCAGGAELNVASQVSLLGLRSGVISKLPDNALGVYIKNQIRFLGVSDDWLFYDSSPDARLGLYYYEGGAAPRKPSIVYDRRFSSVNRLTPEELPDSVYEGVRCFHTSGITLALSPALRSLVFEMVRRFREKGTLISFDVNYRANLWGEAEARAAIEELLPMVDILFASEETGRRMFGKTGTLEDIMKSYCTEFGVRLVATTQRVVVSPKLHHFTSTIYDRQTDRFYREKPYENIDVIDRIGSGDAYVGGVLYGLLQYGEVPQALAFGNAASAVKNTIPGDLPSFDLRELQRIIADHQTDGAVSEMNR